MPVHYQRVFVEGSGSHLPGPPIDNTEMDRFIAPLGRSSERIKRKILQENGILSRHYCIDPEGQTQLSHAQLAAHAIREALQRSERSLEEIELLAVGSSGGDALIPGFAQLIQGELLAPPMSTLSSLGVCAAGVVALEHAASALELGSHRKALVVGADLPSRMFKRSRFAPQGYNAEFDAHFLRWMLSDAAGALVLSNSPRPSGLVLQLEWVHQKSFAGDFPTCMQLGLDKKAQRSYLDYASAAAAEQDGSFHLRQDIRLLPHLFDVSIHEYVKLVQDGWVEPHTIDHFLCHYSSAKFEGVVEDLLRRADLSIPKSRWFSNLRQRGNTGAASIFVMLDEFLKQKRLRKGERILCFVPESARIAASYFMLRVCDASALAQDNTRPPVRRAPSDELSLPTPPHSPDNQSGAVRSLLVQLASAWHDYRSEVWRTPLVSRLRAAKLTRQDYIHFAEDWIPQVRVGTSWMRRAIENLSEKYQPLAALIASHAADEQDDFRILYQDYKTLGGTVALEALRRNPGGEALHSYLSNLAETADPVCLLGAIYVIEGTGQRIIPALLPLLKSQLDLPTAATRFLSYHGENDVAHLQRWLQAAELVLSIDAAQAALIEQTARHTAQLYLMQWQHLRLSPLPTQRTTP